jgi:hypothetical protein
MNDNELRRVYAASRSPGARATDGDRPSLEDMQGLVEGTLAQDKREALLGRVLSDPESTRELAMLSAVSQARPTRQRLQPVHWWTMAAAAVLVIAVGPVLVRSRDAGREQVFRASGGESGTIEILVPHDVVSLTPGLRVTWNASSDADGYTLELVSDRGDAIASIASRDTTLILPDSIPADRLREVAGMMVVARLRDGGQRQSRLRLTRRAP